MDNMNYTTAPKSTAIAAFAEIAAVMPIRELLRQSSVHPITCDCPRCLAIYAELERRNRAEIAAAAAAILETDRLNGRR